MIHIVTYATHEQGKLRELVNNKFDVDVTVLGWGEKWNGFTDKYKGVQKFLETVDDNDIVVFLDGFDTVIEKDPKDLEQLFESKNCDILFSKDHTGEFLKSIFGTCKDGVTANAGMYMGRVKALKPLMKDGLTMRCKDDQVNLNGLCMKYDNLKINVDEDIFYNNIDDIPPKDAIFIQYFDKSPGRISKRITDMAQFYIGDIVIGLLLIAALFPLIRLYVLTLLVVVIVFFLRKCDRSCT